MISSLIATSRVVKLKLSLISPAVLVVSLDLFSRPWIDSANTRTIQALRGRVVGDGLADSLLAQVYETNHIDCVMQHAETQATLNDVCAVQVKATNDTDRPVDLQLWGGDEFTVFTDPEDPRQAFAVVTIDRYNQRTRYKLWFEDEVRTFSHRQVLGGSHGRSPGRDSDAGPRRRTLMAASPSRFCIIELQYDSSGRLDLVRFCVRQSSESTIDFQSWTNLSASTAGQLESFVMSLLPSHPRSALAGSCVYVEVGLGTLARDMPTAASPARNICKPS